ncbi:MAG: HDOD domain-containing protein [Devosiaceae bacterium]|nr:HDOD domain-containing protein [Devosiaceae bacterium]
MDAQFIDKFIAGLLDEIKHKQLDLPTLPEVAIKIGETVDDPDSSAAQLAKIIRIDTALSGRLLQAANSPLFRGKDQINNIKSAITRLGAKQVKTLINSIVIEQVFQSKSSKMVNAILKRQWLHSMQVAAISYVFAQRFTTLKPDNAMLAGLIHDIGSLPILAYADRFPELENDKEQLPYIVYMLHTQIGKLVLEGWNFSPELIAVASEHEHYSRVSDRFPDYVDIVMIANLHTYIGKNHPSNEIDWTEIPAFKALGLTPEESMSALEEARSDVQEVISMLKV